jgi:hypothetical protein
MRKLLLLLAFAAGCSRLPFRQEATAPEQPSLKAQFLSARRFVLVQGSWGLWWGATTRWVFDADGRCFGEVTGGYRNPQANETPIPLPPETFREARQLVLESKLLSLPPGEQNFAFESGGSLTLECQGRKHEITFGSVPEECRQLWDFLSGLRERSKGKPQT